MSTGSGAGAELPLVSVVFLAYNRREQLLCALDQMTQPRRLSGISA